MAAASGASGHSLRNAPTWVASPGVVWNTTLEPSQVGTLALRTAAKPLAGRFQAYVLGHPKFRQNVINIAQWMHRTEVYITRGAEGRTGKYIVGNMSEDRALELSAKVVSEAFVFSVGAAVIGWEYSRNRRKDQDKQSRESADRQKVDTEFQREKEALAELNTRLLGKLQEQAGRLDAELWKLERTLVLVPIAANWTRSTGHQGLSMLDAASGRTKWHLTAVVD
ncbi:hypothetical protein WJX84_012368 [Apatococcus fuscideae]|uniref:OPA3-like protein n=1 Tax=Apatococcus fuscideae TaxID=2026836 RepID=A0AAW1TCR9_9CHLO